MRKHLKGLDNTPSGAKFARERHLEANPGDTVHSGCDRGGYFLDIIKPRQLNNTVRMPARLRLVKS